MQLNNVKTLLTTPSAMFYKLSSMKLLNWIPDKQYLSIAWRLHFRKKLNWKEPQTFNEKLQWLKLHDHKPQYTQLVDKYEVRKYISNTIGEEYLIPLVGGPWNSFDEIDFNTLPEQFVLKCTHDSGGLVICRDKKKLDIEASRNKINKSLKRNYFWAGREWPYKNVKPRIIAEQYMENSQFGVDGLVDFKFFCLNGEPKFLYVSSGLEHHSTAHISFVGLDGKRLEFKRSDYREYDNIPIPENFELMKQIAGKCAKRIGSDFIRIDLYEINGVIKFSEFTFSPCGGMLPFDPPEWDERIGNLITLSNT